MKWVERNADSPNRHGARLFLWERFYRDIVAAVQAFGVKPLPQSRSYNASLLQRVEKLPHHPRPVREHWHRSLNLHFVLPMQTIAAILLD